MSITVSTPSHGHYSPVQGKDDIGCPSLLLDEPEKDFLYVGPGRGHFEESMRGNFHYVGPNGGHYELRRRPPKRFWKRVAVAGFFLVCCCAFFGFFFWSAFLAPPPEYDCLQGLDDPGVWQPAKREYCCEEENLGCAGSGFKVPPESRVPRWLKAYLGDTSLGLKFMVSSFLLLLVGCCCGACCMDSAMARWTHRPRGLSEAELEVLLKRYLRRLNATTDGELSVTLMWDTVDDLDLHLDLPENFGEICSERPEVDRGMLEIDGNYTLDLGSTMPLEHITWPALDRSNKRAPPEGEYQVYVKVFARYQFDRDINITIQIAQAGREPRLLHQRIVGAPEVKVCTFTYP